MGGCASVPKADNAEPLTTEAELNAPAAISTEPELAAPEAASAEQEVAAPAADVKVIRNFSPQIDMLCVAGRHHGDHRSHA